MVGLGFYGISNGDPYNILTPFDTEGNRCGAPGQGAGGTKDFTDYPLKFFSNFGASENTVSGIPKSKKELFRSVCVSECPLKTVQTNCQSNSTCPIALLDTTAQHKYCLPTGESIAAAMETLFEKMNENNNFG